MEKLKKLFVVLIVLIFTFSLGIGIVPEVKAVTAEELRAKIAELQAQIAKLQKQLEAIEGTPTKTWCHNFYRNLRYGDRGPEVYALQEALRKEGFKISEIEHTTRINAYFGITTASSVVGFQEKYKEEILAPWSLRYGTGFVGKTTRKKLNELYGCGVIPPLPPTTCFDTDGGKNYYVKGTVSSKSGVFTDICGKGNDLIEYYCDKNSEIKSIIYNCPNGCKNGACVEAEKSCVKECQKRGYEYGQCRTGVVYYKTKICKDNELDIGPNGCSQDSKRLGVTSHCCCGKKITSCTDTDGGKNYYVKGTATDKYVGSKTDYCVEHPENSSDKRWEVIEYWCEDAGDDRGPVVHSDGHYCPYGCKNGACIRKVSVLSPNIFLMSGDSTMISDEDNFVNVSAVTKEFFKTQKDEYDFISIYTTFDPPQSQYLSHYLVLNNIKGIGLLIQDSSDIYGSNGKLKGVNFMRNIDMYSVDEEETYNALKHETGHQWLAYVGGNCDSDTGFKIIRQHIHWNFCLDTRSDSSGKHKDPMGGRVWIDNEDGTFRALDHETGLSKETRFCPLSLYLMGLISPEGVPDITLIEPKDGDLCSLQCSLQSPVEGRSKKISIKEIINLEGERTPAWPDTQKDFKMAFILLTKSGKDATKEQKEKIKKIASEFPQRWYIATGGKSTMNAEIRKCTDTDGGKNYYVKGSTTGIPDKNHPEIVKTLTDFCEGNVLHEYFCYTWPDGTQTIASTAYNCPNGCQDGACVKKPSITVLYPNGGEKWHEGKKYTIRWKSKGLTSSDKISIEIWRDDNSNTIIGTVPGNTTSYTWKVNLSEIKWGKPCFAKGTKVLVKSFERGEEMWPIEKIKPGDYVVSFDLEKREKTFSKVRRVIQREDPLVIINKTLKAAPDQLIYTNKGFKKAKEIKVGDFLLNQKGELVRVFSIKEDSIKRETFDLILEKEPENFFAEGFLVHSAPSEYKYKISLRVYKKYISDDSNDYFAIIPSTTTCTDTDGGKNYYVKGSTTGIPDKNHPEIVKTLTDFCEGNVLHEYFCYTWPDGTQTIASTAYNCPNGCQDGACVKKPSITVLYPNGGEKWTLGQIYKVKWKSAGVEKVNILLIDYMAPESCYLNYSPIDAEKGEFVINGLSMVRCKPGAGSWMKEKITPGDKYVIRVENANDRSLNDSSDSYFSIKDINACKKIIYNGNPLNKIDIVFIGDKYSTDELDLFKQDVDEFIDEEGTHRGFFSIEPFKSYRDRFNFYRIDKSYNFGFEKISYPSSKLIELIWDTARKECPEVDELIVLLNHVFEGGQFKAFSYPHFVLVTRKHPFADWNSEYEFAAQAIFVHEFGHAFGNLEDEREDDSAGARLDRPNCDVAGCPKWCSGKIDTSKPCWNLIVQFNNCVESGETSENCYNKLTPEEQFRMSTCDIGIDCLEGTACVFNCDGTNGYRPTYWRNANDYIPCKMADPMEDVFCPVCMRHLIKTIEEKTTASCTDTDGGKNYYVKGSTTGIPDKNHPEIVKTLTDFCEGNVLHEYFCYTWPDGTQTIASTAYNCPNGCQDGACVKKVTVIKNVKKQLASISAIILQLQEKVKELLKR